MREMDFRQIDLNLLVALDALLAEMNVTRAAHRLGMSQPAASRALGRLRALFADALLVDGPGGYVLSARAEEVRPVLRRILAGIGEMLEANQFDPATAKGQVRLLMPDLQAAALAPHLLARLAREAPSLDLDIVAPGANGIKALEHDDADAMVALIDEAPAGIRRRRLYDEKLVTLMRVKNPAAVGKLTLARFLALEHIVVSVTGVGHAPVDEGACAHGAEAKGEAARAELLCSGGDSRPLRPDHDPAVEPGAIRRRHEALRVAAAAPRSWELHDESRLARASAGHPQAHLVEARHCRGGGGYVIGH